VAQPACFEVLALAGVDEVEDAAGAQAGDAEADGGQVGGAVEVLADGFPGQGLLLDDQRVVVAGDGDDGGAFAFDGQALGLELGNDLGEVGVVEGFAAVDGLGLDRRVGQLDVEARVHRGTRVEGDLAGLFPGTLFLLVAVAGPQVLDEGGGEAREVGQGLGAVETVGDRDGGGGGGVGDGGDELVGPLELVEIEVVALEVGVEIEVAVGVFVDETLVPGGEVFDDVGQGGGVFFAGGGLLARQQAVEDVAVAGALEDGFVPHRQDDAAELGAPVAEVVLADDAVAGEIKRAGDGVADDGGT
jgi:hypothetical protein